ncbi:MAG TPA: LuxR C-terminal-related transcriptional regulator [Phycisphaerales bacterium]|nr:LuxR C-terminal-related transcriptional regulator [Phycisphaerales bacterium]
MWDQTDRVLALESGLSVPLATFENSTTAMSLLREDGLILYTNAAALALFVPGKTPGELRGKFIQDLEPRDFYTERVEVLRRLAREDRNGVIRDIFDGRQILTHVRLLPPNPDSTMRTFLCIHQLVSGEQSAPDDPDVLWHEGENQDLGLLAILSKRELEVLALVGQGLTAAEIAAKLHRSEDTIKSHKSALLRKLACKNAVQLAIIAQHAGLKLEDADRLR